MGTFQVPMGLCINSTKYNTCTVNLTCTGGCTVSNGALVMSRWRGIPSHTGIAKYSNHRQAPATTAQETVSCHFQPAWRLWALSLLCTMAHIEGSLCRAVDCDKLIVMTIRDTFFEKGFILVT